MQYVQCELKLVVGKKFNLLNYITKHKTVHGYEITKHRKFMFLKIFEVAVIRFATNVPNLSQFMPYVCEHAEVHR